jgi:hypothetical protein
MKNGPKRPHRNGHVPTRAELIAAQERALLQDEKLTAKEGFEALVNTGIINRKGKLARRYGGTAKNQPFRW